MTDTEYNTGKARWIYGTPIHVSSGMLRRLLGPCPRCGAVTSEYGCGFNCHEDYCPNNASNFTCRTVDDWPEWWDTDILVALDGNSWCATKKGFVNLQESPAGFGNTPNEAVTDLLGQSQ